MGVFKRGNTYWIDYSVTGKRYRESAHTSHKRLALELLAKRKVEIFEGRYFPEKRRTDLTLDDLRSMWLEAASDKKSIHDDESRFAAILNILGENLQVNGLTSGDVQKLRDTLMNTTTRKHQTMARATVNKHLALLRAAFNLATKRGFAHQNPCAGVRFLREDNERDRICSKEEFNLLVTHADPELRLALFLGFYTGMRRGVIASLKWADIDLKTGFIRLSASVTKTNTARQVPLVRQVLTEFEHYPRRLDGAVFSVSKDAITGRFGRLRRKLGIENLTFHDLRHSSATNFRRAGVDILALKQIIGHKTWAMLERYNQFTPDDLTKAVERLSHEEG